MQSHLNTLSLLICGIIGAGHTHLSEISAESPENIKAESRSKKFKRWLSNDKVSLETYWLPFARALVAKLGGHKNEVTVAIDGSVVG